LYYNRERNTQNEERNHINDYADFIRANSSEIRQAFAQLEDLDAATKAQLGLTSSDT